MVLFILSVITFGADSSPKGGAKKLNKVIKTILPPPFGGGGPRPERNIISGCHIEPPQNNIITNKSPLPTTKPFQSKREGETGQENWGSPFFFCRVIQMPTCAQTSAKMHLDVVK